MIVSTYSPWLVTPRIDLPNYFRLTDRTWIIPLPASTRSDPVWTIEYDGDEQSFEEWGVRGARLSQRNQESDQLTFTVDGDVTADPTFSYGAKLILRKGRTQTGSTWTGGRKFFEGYVSAVPGEGLDQSESHVYQVSSAWWLLERLVYQHNWKVYSVSKGKMVEVYSSHLFLGLSYDPATGKISTISTGEQIGRVLQYLNSNAGDPLYIGSGYPETDFLYFEVRDLTCAETVKKLLRWNPDAITWFDYSTDPPTLYVQKRTGQAAATLAFGESPCAEVRLSPRTDLSVPVVCLKYERTDTFDGNEVLVCLEDKYPAEKTGNEVGGVVQTINLLGASQQYVKGWLKTRLIQINSGLWWKNHQPWLNDSRVQSITVLNYWNGFDVNTYCNEVIEGQACSWMYDSFYGYAGSVKGMVKATLRVTMTGAENELIHKDVVVSATITATNMEKESGYMFSTLSNAVAAEQPPAGLAQSLYEALFQTHYSGTVKLLEDECGDWLEDQEITNSLGLGLVLNITGGKSDWATMRAQIQGVDMDLDTGTTTLTLGPPAHLGAADLVEWLRENRTRVVYNNPNLVSTGIVSNGPKLVQLPQNSADASSAAGADVHQRFVVATAASEGHVERKAILDSQEDESRMVLGTGTKEVLLSDEDTEGHPVAIRKMDACRINEDGSYTWGFRMVACSDFFEEEEEEGGEE